MILQDQRLHGASEASRVLREFIVEDELTKNTGREPLLQSIYI